MSKTIKKLKWAAEPPPHKHPKKGQPWSNQYKAWWSREYARLCRLCYPHLYTDEKEGAP